MKDLQIKLRDLLARADALTSQASRTPEEETQLSDLVTEGQALKAQIDRAQQLASLAEYAGQSLGSLPLAGASAQPGTVSVEGSLPAGAATVARKGSGLSVVDDEGPGYVDETQLRVISAPAYKAAFRQYLRGGERGLKADALKVLQEGSDTQGGFLVPEDLLARIIAREPTPTRIAARTTQLQTSRDALLIPRVNYAADDIYTTGMRITWTGEVPASSATHRVTEPVFGLTRIPVSTAMMSLPLTNDMVEDAAFPVISWASAKFGETLELLRDNMVLNGSGQGQPAGILLNPGAADQPAVVNSGAAAALTADGLVKLAFSLPEQYDQNAAFVFNKVNTGQALGLLKDTTNRYLWGAGLQDNGLSPSLRNRPLLGYDTLLSGFMPNVAANAFPIIFGDLGGYYLVNRIGLSIQVLRELYAETNQVLLLARVRFGGQVAEPWRIKVQQVAA